MNSNQTSQHSELAREVIGQQQGRMYFAMEESRIHAASTSVGSGKTKASIEYMLSADKASRNFIYVAPTINLVEQTTKNLKDKLTENNISTKNVNLIHSQRTSHEETATASALNKLNDTESNIGAVVILTTTTFLTVLPMITRKEDWHVVLDEAFSPLSFVEYQLGKEDRDKGREYFESLFKVEANDYNNIRPADRKYKLVQSVASGDWVEAGTKYQGMQKLSQSVLNSALRVELASKHKDRYLFATWVTPDYFEDFAEVVFLSALFEQSILYHLWQSMYDIEFKSHRFFEVAIERNVHQSQGMNVSIGHLLHEDDFASKYNLQRNHKTGEPYETEVGNRVIDKMMDTVSMYFTGKKYLVQVNKWTGYHTNLKHTLSKLTEVIPTISHGLNKYADQTAIAALAVTNPESYQMKWLQKRTQLTEEAIYRAYRIHTVYQACGRTAIRDGDNKKPVVFLTVGKADAQFLHQLFEGSTWLGQIGSLPKYRKDKLKLIDNPEYIKQRRIYKRLKAKESRGTLDEVGIHQLNEARLRMSTLNRDSSPK